VIKNRKQEISRSLNSTARQLTVRAEQWWSCFVVASSRVVQGTGSRSRGSRVTWS